MNLPLKHNIYRPYVQKHPTYYSSGIDTNQNYRYIDQPEVIPPESIQIKIIDISTNRRLFLRNRYKSKLSIYRPTGGYWSRRNRIGSNRANVAKSSVRWGFEYTFSRQKRNVNRTCRPLHSPSRVSVSGHIHCGPAIVLSAKTA